MVILQWNNSYNHPLCEPKQAKKYYGTKAEINHLMPVLPQLTKKNHKENNKATKKVLILYYYYYFHRALKTLFPCYQTRRSRYLFWMSFHLLCITQTPTCHLENNSRITWYSDLPKARLQMDNNRFHIH